MKTLNYIIFSLVLLCLLHTHSAFQSKQSASVNNKLVLSEVRSPGLENVISKEKLELESKILPVVKCPEPETLGPCICDPAFNRVKHEKEWAQKLEIQCFNVTDDYEFEKVFETFFPIPFFYKLYVHWDSNITILRAGVFKDISFEAITISTDTLVTLEDGALDSSITTLKRLILQTNINNFPFYTLEKYRSLTHFDISYNNITSCPIITSSTLTYLDLSGNRMKDLPQGAFNNLPALEYLRLSNIELQNLQPGVFNGLVKVQSIDLNSQYRLTMIPSGAFSGLPSLRRIDLSPGFIETVKQGAFDAIPGLHIDLQGNCMVLIEEEVWKSLFEVGVTLDLSYQLYNNLECGCDVAWLIREPIYLHQITNSTTCSDGRLLHDLGLEDIVDCP